MPILDDIMDHDVLGPAIRQGMERGREEGSQIGRNEEALAYTLRLMTRRFGALPAELQQCLGKMSTSELEDLGERMLDAASLSDLFGGN